MRVPIRSHREPISLNMTPLIDVVFLLIIFFLVSSHLARQETQLELNLPTAASGQPQADENRPRVTIHVLPDGRIILGGNETQHEEMIRRLKYERRSTDENLEVRIRADRSVPYQIVEPILLACAESGIWNVTFAVIKKEAD